MNVHDFMANLTDADISEVQRQLLRRGVLGANSWPWPVGSKMLIRTVTHYWLGKIKQIGYDYFLLEEAASVPHEGRRSEVLVKGIHDEEKYDYKPEVEPIPQGEAVVMRAAIVDVVLWEHDIPREIKLTDHS